MLVTNVSFLNSFCLLPKEERGEALLVIHNKKTYQINKETSIVSLGDIINLSI